MGLLSWDQTLASEYIKNNYILVGLYYQISQNLCSLLLDLHIFYFRNYFDFQILKVYKMWVCKKIKSYSQHKFNSSVWLQSSRWIIHHLSKTLRLYLPWNCRHGSVFKSTCCVCKWPRFDSQKLFVSLQLSASLILEDLVPLTSLCRNQACMWYANINAGNTFIQVI